MRNNIILEILLVNRGEEHLPVVSALDVPPYYCIAPIASHVLISLQYHFSFNT